MSKSEAAQVVAEAAVEVAVQKPAKAELDPKQVFEYRFKENMPWQAMRDTFEVKMNSTRFYQVMLGYVLTSKGTVRKECVEAVEATPALARAIAKAA